MAHFHCKDIDKELLNDVKDEAAEQQDRVEQTILQIEDNQDDEQSLRVLFRCVHNIKGNIGLSGLQPLIPVVHHLEDILGLLRENKIQYQPAIGDLTLLVLDCVRQFIEACIQSNTIEYDEELFEQLAKLMHSVDNEHSPALFHAIALLDPSVEYDIEAPHVNSYVNTNEDLAFFKQVMDAMEFRNSYWAGRGERLISLALAMNNQSGKKVDPNQLIAAIYVHDISMAFLPLSLLQQSTPLSIADKKLMQNHVHPGFQLLSQNPHWLPAANFVLQHHEKANGTGYPNGLSEMHISDGAKILAIIDAYDAITHGLGSNANFKRPIMRAIMEISRNSGKQFSEYWVDVFMQVVRKVS